MTLEHYSAFLSLGLFLLAGALALGTILYAFVPAVRRAIDQRPYRDFLIALSFVGAAGVIGALVYQLAYATPVCELCWWQRIFLFPIPIIALVALWYRAHAAHVTIAILSALGLFYALYHYYYHFQGLVLGNAVSLPCSTGGLLPACTESPILTFGFVTIPLMAALAFLSFLMLSYFAHRAARRDGGRVF